MQFTRDAIIATAVSWWTSALRRRALRRSARASAHGGSARSRRGGQGASEEGGGWGGWGRGGGGGGCGGGCGGAAAEAAAEAKKRAVVAMFERRNAEKQLERTEGFNLKATAQSSRVLRKQRSSGLDFSRAGTRLSGCRWARI